MSSNNQDNTPKNQNLNQDQKQTNVTLEELIEQLNNEQEIQSEEMGSLPVVEGSSSQEGQVSSGASSTEGIEGGQTTGLPMAEVSTRVSGESGSSGTSSGDINPLSQPTTTDVSSLPQIPGPATEEQPSLESDPGNQQLRPPSFDNISELSTSASLEPTEASASTENIEQLQQSLGSQTETESADVLEEDQNSTQSNVELGEFLNEIDQAAQSALTQEQTADSGGDTPTDDDNDSLSGQPITYDQMRQQRRLSRLLAFLMFVTGFLIGLAFTVFQFDVNLSKLDSAQLFSPKCTYCIKVDKQWGKALTSAIDYKPAQVPEQQEQDQAQPPQQQELSTVVVRPSLSECKEGKWEITTLVLNVSEGVQNIKEISIKLDQPLYITHLIWADKKATVNKLSRSLRLNFEKDGGVSLGAQQSVILKLVVDPKQSDIQPSQALKATFSVVTGLKSIESILDLVVPQECNAQTDVLEPSPTPILEQVQDQESEQPQDTPTPTLTVPATGVGRATLLIPLFMLVIGIYLLFYPEGWFYTWMRRVRK